MVTTMLVTATDCTSGVSTCTSAGCSLKWIKARHQQSTMIKIVLPAKGTMTYILQWDECWNINLAATTCAMSEEGRER